MKRRNGSVRAYAGFILMCCLFAFLFWHFNSKIFDISSYSVENEYKTISELTSKAYDGRLAGTKGNQLALSYAENYFKKIGVQPGGENGTFYQTFNSMVPMHKSKPYLRLYDKSGVLIHDLQIGKDYRELLDGYGGNGVADAPLLFIKDWVGNYKPAQLRGKVLVTDMLIGDNDIEFAISNGVKGILCPVVKSTAKTPVSTETKQGKTILIDLLEPSSFSQVLACANSGGRVQMKLDEQFQSVSTPNLIGKIEGTGKGYVLFSALIDGYGSEPDGKLYYPGAINGATGVSIVLELARVFSVQKHKPDKTIVFVLWNNELHGKKGKQYYIDHPVYPLAESSILFINNVGSKNSQQFKLDYSGQASQIFRDRIKQFSRNVLGMNEPGLIREFSKTGAVAVSITENLLELDSWGAVQEYMELGTPGDGIEKVGKPRLAEASMLLLSFVKREVAGDIIGGIFKPMEKLLLGLLLLALLTVFLFNTLFKQRPQLRIGRMTIEDIYYSTAFELFDKLIRRGCQAGIVIVLLVFLTRIPADLNLIRSNGVIHTNFSWSKVVSDTVDYFRSLTTSGFGTTSTGMEVWEYIRYSFAKSFLLLLAVLIAGIIFGIAKGIFDSIRDDARGNLRAAGTIVMFSLPDVFVVIALQMLFIYLYSNGMISVPREYLEQRLFVEAFLCLILLPSVYITRIASVAVHEEKKKGYIKAAKAKGLSDFGVIRHHLLVSVLIKVTEALPSVLSLMISNLIIVEYICGYKGIVTNMLLAFREREIDTYTGLALSLCALYVSFVILFKLASKLLNPLKRREV